MKKKWLNATYHVVNGKQKMLPEYNQWFDMYQRCLSERSKCVRKTYRGCTIQESWKSYDEWLGWAKEQQGFLKRDSNGNLFQIDKDLIGNGMRYDERSCCFLPKDVNIFLVNKFNGFQKLSNGSYRVVVSKFGSRESLGCYKDYHKALEVYLRSKKDQALLLAETWKLEISNEAYEKLVQYKPRAIDQTNS